MCGLFVHGCLLFLSLHWRVVYLLKLGFSVGIIIVRFPHVGKAFVKKIQGIYRNTSIVDYPSRKGKDNWMEGYGV